MGLIETQEMLGILNGDISVPTQHITMPNDQTQEDNPDYRACLEAIWLSPSRLD